MKDNFMNKCVLITSYVFLTCTVACGGSGTSSSSPGDVSPSSAVSVEFNLENAVALLVTSQAFYADLRKVSTKSTPSNENILALLEDNSVVPAYELSNAENNSSVENLTKSASSELEIAYRTPQLLELGSGDFIIIFEQTVLMNGSECDVAYVSLDNQPLCIVQGLEASSITIRVDNNNNVYYLIDNVIKSWNYESQETAIVINADEINFSLDNFLFLSDGSLILLGQLSGLSDVNFFRYNPNNESDLLEEDLCVSYVYRAEPGEEDAEYLIHQSQNGDIYISYSNNCFEENSFSVVQLRLNEGTLEFDLLSDDSPESSELGEADDLDEYEFVEDSEGNVYLYNGDMAILIDEEGFEIISFSSISDAESYGQNGNYILAIGTNNEGERVFIRKNLLNDQEEIDLLNGQSLLVQYFDISNNGDVYFNALDLDSLETYLFKYNNDTSELEELAELPTDVEEIIMLQ